MARAGLLAFVLLIAVFVWIGEPDRFPALGVAGSCATNVRIFGSDGKSRPDPCERANDYAVELGDLSRQIDEQKQKQPSARTKAHDSTRLASLLYRRSLLTGNDADFDEVEAALDESLRSVGPLEDLYFLRACLHFRLHRLTRAEEDLERLSHLDTWAPVIALSADIALQHGQYGDAREGYEKAIAQDRSWDHLVRMAYLESVTGNLERARELYGEAEEELSAKEMRSFAWIEVQLGLLDLKQGRLSQARVRYERADKAYSGYWWIEEHIAELCAAQGRFDEAIKLYEKVLADAPRPEFQQSLGDLYQFLDSRALARSWHDMALAGYLDSVKRGEPRYLHHLASFYCDAHKDSTEAVKWARRDVEVRQFFSVHAELAWALSLDGQAADAVEEMDCALECGIEDAHMFSLAAQVYSSAGKSVESKQFQDRAAAMDPGLRSTFHVHR